MKPYYMYSVVGIFSISMLCNAILYQQRNNFDLHYVNAQSSQYDIRTIKDLSYQFEVDKGAYTWMAEVNGSEANVYFQGEKEYPSFEPFAGKFYNKPKIDPAIIREHESEAICTTDDLGETSCNLYFTLQEAEMNLMLDDQIIDTVTIRAKEEDKPIHVFITRTHEDELTSDQAIIQLTPTYTETRKPLMVVQDPSEQFANYTDFMSHEKDRYLVYNAAEIKRFNPVYYDISKDLTGIYDKSNALYKIIEYDSLQEGYKVLDTLDERMIALKTETDQITYLESYDASGKLIVQLPIGESKTIPYAGTIDHQYLVTENIDDKLCLRIYAYQDDDFVLLDEFMNANQFMGTIRYHDGKVYSVSFNNMNSTFQVKVWNHDELIFDGELAGAIFNDQHLYQSDPLAISTTWDQLMKTTYETNYFQKIEYTMKD